MEFGFSTGPARAQPRQQLSWEGMRQAGAGFWLTDPQVGLASPPYPACLPCLLHPCMRLAACNNLLLTDHCVTPASQHQTCHVHGLPGVAAADTGAAFAVMLPVSSALV